MKILIIGGVAGGASTASRLRRLDEQAEIILFEKGEYISYANCGLPYYIGGVINERKKLFVQSVEGFSNRYEIDVRTKSEVIEINLAEKFVSVKDYKGNTYKETYDKLVLSPGAEPIVPPIPGINHKNIFTLRNVTDTDRIKQYTIDNKIQKAVVIGGGFIGLEMVENLHDLGIEITLIEKSDQVMAPIDKSMASIVHQHLIDKKVNLLLNQNVTEFKETGEEIKVVLENNQEIDTQMVLLSIGVKPDIKLAKEAGLQIGESGGIVVNQFLHTSDENVYALGDAIEVINPVLNRKQVIPLAGPANKQARFVADNIINGDTKAYPGSIGTAIAKVFELTVGSAGVSSKVLDRENIPHVSSYTHGNSHATYYPDAKGLSIKINFSEPDGKLLGAQVVGFAGVDKRTDLLAQVIKKGGTIYDLQDIEHAYAPPYSSAKDPVNMAGFVAENILKGKVKIIHWDKLANMDENEVFIIDVRDPKELKDGFIKNSINIPLNELRYRLDEVPEDKTIVLYCAIGLRGYLASNILVQNGYQNVYNLSGGFKTYSSNNDKL